MIMPVKDYWVRQNKLIYKTKEKKFKLRKNKNGEIFINKKKSNLVLKEIIQVKFIEVKLYKIRNNLRYIYVQKIIGFKPIFKFLLFFLLFIQNFLAMFDSLKI